MEKFVCVEKLTYNNTRNTYSRKKEGGTMDYALLILVGIGIVVIGIFLSDHNKTKTQNFEQTNNLSREYGIVHFTSEYLGGHPRMTGTGNVTITASKDSLIWTGNRPILIPLDTIKSVEMKTEQQISKDVTLTRLLMTGIFALAWKKKTTTENIYLIFNFEEYEVPYTAIFRADNKYNVALKPVADIVNITTRNLIELHKNQSQELATVNS